MKTHAPSLTKRCAVANPIPSVPPVITATFPCNLPIEFLFFMRICFACLVGVNPFPNIRDGIFVERLVKALRYVAEMRRRQYVVQPSKGVIRRQRLNVEYVDRRASDLLGLQRADQSLLVDNRAARRIDKPGRWLHSLQLSGPYEAFRTAAQHHMDR